MYTFGSDNSTQSISTQYNITSCLSDMFTSSDTSSDNFSNLDEAVRNIMAGNSIHTDIGAKSNPQSDVIMYVVNSLYDQIAFLKDQITFLRAESLSKNSMIGRLFSDISDLQTRINYHDRFNLDSNSSSMLNNLMGAPNFHSSFQDDNADLGIQINDVSLKSEPPLPKPSSATSSEPVEIKVNKFKNIGDQLKAIRLDYHNEFKNGDSSKRGFYEEEVTDVPRVKINDNNEFPKGTVVVVGDSIINQLTDEGLSGKTRNVKVFAYGGANTSDIKFQLMKIIPRKPSHIILHVATNNATLNTSRQICDDLLFLKFLIMEKLPDCGISISCPILRTDNSKANLTLVHLDRYLKALSINIIDNSNICEVHLGRKGLHLNGRGNKQLAANFIAHMQKF